MITLEYLNDWYDLYKDDVVTAMHLCYILEVPSRFIEKIEDELSKLEGIRHEIDNHITVSIVRVSDLSLSTLTMYRLEIEEKGQNE